MKKYNSSWYAQPLIVNFNYKQWRQDLAAFIKRKEFWDYAIVTKARATDKRIGLFPKGAKWFEIFDGHGRYVRIIFSNKKEILEIQPSNFNEKLIEEYFNVRILGWKGEKNENIN